MKKIFLLLSSLMFISPLVATGPTGPGGAMLPMPSEQEMQEIQKFLDTLSPEELDELAKIGEEIIQTAEKEGRPLFGPAPEAQPTPKPVRSTSTSHAVKEKEPQKPKARILSTREKSRIQRILSGLVETIASIRQKSTSDETLLQLLAPLNTALNDFTYYLNVVNYSKHLVHLTDKEFTPLNDNLRKLYEQIEEIDSELEVPEIEMSKKQTSDDIKKQRKKIKNAAKLLSKFVSIIETSTKQKHVLTDLERLVKKYEPEALKIKKEQEEKERKASTQSTSLPKTNVVQIYKPSAAGARGTQQYTGRPSSRAGSYGGPSYGSSARPGSSMGFPGSNTQSPNGTPGKTNASGGKKGTGETAEKDKKKEGTKPEAPRKLTDIERTHGLEDGIKKRMDAANQLAGAHYDKLTALLDEYLPGTDAVVDHLSRDYENIVADIAFELGKVKKDVTAWVTKVKTQATSGGEFREHKNHLKAHMDNNMRALNAIRQKIKDSPGLLTGTAPRVVLHRESINQLVKHVDDIKKELSKSI